MEAELSSRAKTLFWASVVLGTMSVCLLGFATYRYQTVTFLQLLMILLVSIQLVFSSEDNLQLDTSILLSLLVISYILWVPDDLMLYWCRSWKKIKERREARQAQEVFRQTTDEVTDDQSSDEEAGEMGDGQLCVICLRKRRKAAFIPCGHLVCCCKCALIVERQFDPLCPMCRQDIRYMIRIYDNWGTWQVFF